MNKNCNDLLGIMLSSAFDIPGETQDTAVMEQAEHDLLEKGCHFRHLYSGEVFIHSGFCACKVCILLRGSAKVICYNNSGLASIQDRLIAPQMFGLMEAIDGRISYAASVEADSPSYIMEVPVHLFRSLIDECNSAAQVIIRNLCYMAVRNMNNVEYYALNRPQETLVLYLYRSCMGQPLPYVLTSNRKLLAEILHINLRSLYRYLNELKSDGVCNTVKGKITITQEAFVKLKERCEQLL
ncbi:MAG: cyclic nucleotide-binding domain-containing protein [Oscillospiraceae bacterium]